jgi:hypothetical protein
MRMTSLATALALLAPPATTLTSAGCFPPLICTLVGFDNGLHVDIAVPTTPAAYRVEVEADGEMLSLRYEVTSQGIGCLECMIAGESLRVSDSFSPNPQSLAVNIGRVDGEGGPRVATVRVFRDDALAAEARFEPRYETDEPNGRGCGEHVFASAALVVP